MLTQQETTNATEAIKTLLKHRRIKSNSELRLIAAITKDMCLKAQKEFPELNITHNVIEPENDNKTTAQIIAESKNDIEQFLKYLLTDELIDSLNLNELAKHSQLLAHEIIYDVMCSFDFKPSDYDNSIIVKNTRTNNHSNVVWFEINENETTTEIYHKIVEEFCIFIGTQKAVFKPIVMS